MNSVCSDRLKPAGFPHSEISGSRVICTSPELIAAYHVLHRLHAPRHPPCALSSLTIKFAHRKTLDQHTGLSSASLFSSISDLLQAAQNKLEDAIGNLPIRLSKSTQFTVAFLVVRRTF